MKRVGILHVLQCLRPSIPFAFSIVMTLIAILSLVICTSIFPVGRQPTTHGLQLPPCLADVPSIPACKHNPSCQNCSQPAQTSKNRERTENRREFTGKGHVFSAAAHQHQFQGIAKAIHGNPRNKSSGQSVRHASTWDTMRRCEKDIRNGAPWLTAARAVREQGEGLPQILTRHAQLHHLVISGLNQRVCGREPPPDPSCWTACFVGAVEDPFAIERT